MYISKVSLVNYRNFKNSKFIFNKNINTIIGENGSGKTNLFRAIRLLLDDNLLKYAYKLNENDFNRDLDEWRGHWIIISLEFSELSQDEAIQALFVHGVGDAGTIPLTKATYNLFFRPKADIRMKLSQLNEGDITSLTTIRESISIDDYEAFFTGKSTIDFNEPDTYKELVGDFENVIFPDEIDESKFGIKIPHQLSISNEISFTFVKALRDVVSDFNSNRTNPLLNLLNNKSEDIPDEDFEPIATKIREVNEKIENLTDIKTIKSDIKDTIKEAVGETYAPSSIAIKSNLSDEADKLLQSLKLFISEPNETYEGAIHELSLGGANLIFLTLKLLEYKYRKDRDKFANFLLIEEPEAHIHTHIQKTLFDNLEYSDTQIIYSTHSPQISEVSKISNINILAKKQNYAEVYQPSNGLSSDKIVKLERYLDAIRTNLLFAKGVLLVEGDAEAILIPNLVKNVFGITLDELGISLINIGSTGFENVAQIFHDNRLQRKCSIITDLDAAIVDTTPSDEDGEKLKKYKEKLLRSEQKGEARKVILEDFISGNQWIKIFYADHTFEVDFIKSGNTNEAKSLCEQIYTNATKISEAEREILSGDIGQYGKRILTMANKQGKGWFSILLSEQITFQTKIPKYILDAILFLNPLSTKHLKVNVINHRIKKSIEENNTLDFSDVETKIQAYLQDECHLSEIKDLLQSIIPNDQVLEILERV